MNRAEDERSEPDRISTADYEGHEGRIVRLEEFRRAHEREHDNHVATQAWVYRAVIAAAAPALRAAVWALTRSLG